MKKIILRLAVLSSVLVFLPSISYAVNVCSPTSTVSVEGQMGDILNRICINVFNLGLFAVIIGFIISGIFFVIAAGDPNRFKTATQFLIYTIIGGIVIFMGVIFLRFAQYMVTGQ